MSWLAWHYSALAQRTAVDLSDAGRRLADAQLALERASATVAVHGDMIEKLDAQFRRLQGRLYAEKRGRDAPAADDDIDDGLRALLNYQNAAPAKPS